MIAEREAAQFLDYGDDARPDDPQSMHYRFVHAHAAVMEARKDRAAVRVAGEEVMRLNWSVSSYLQDLTTTFAQRSAALALIARSSLPQTTAGRGSTPSHSGAR